MTLRTKYLMGGLMQPLTCELIEKLSRNYPNSYTDARIAFLKESQGEYGCDCSGLIKSFLFGIGAPEYDLFFDRNSRKRNQIEF